MDAPPRRWAHEKALDTLAGFELGVLGGVLMLGWYAAAAPVLAQPWWTLWNGSASRVLSRNGPWLTTIAGAGLHILYSSAAGAAAGFFAPGNRLICLGAALVWYLASYWFVWPRLAPMLAFYSPQAVLAVGFLIWGSVLGYYPQVWRAVHGFETPRA